jgi:hypothetical protein
MRRFYPVDGWGLDRATDRTRRSSRSPPLRWAVARPALSAGGASDAEPGCSCRRTRSPACCHPRSPRSTDHVVPRRVALRRRHPDGACKLQEIRPSWRGPLGFPRHGRCVTLLDPQRVPNNLGNGHLPPRRDLGGNIDPLAPYLPIRVWIPTWGPSGGAAVRVPSPAPHRRFVSACSLMSSRLPSSWTWQQLPCERRPSSARCRAVCQSSSSGHGRVAAPVDARVRGLRPHLAC